MAARLVPFRTLVRNPDEPPARALVGIGRAFLLTNSTAQAEAQQLRVVRIAPARLLLTFDQPWGRIFGN